MPNGSSSTVPSSLVRSQTLATIAELLGLANVLAPDVLAIIALLKSRAAAFDNLIADADTIEQAEIKKLQAQLGK